MERLTPGVLGPVLMAALVSSALSSLASGCLALGSVATHNVYHALLRPAAQEREVCWVLRLAMVASGALSISVYNSLGITAGLLRLCADLAYVTLFPQLLAAFYLPSNAYGCLAGFAAAALLRALCGAPEVGLPAAVRLPLFDERRGEQRFPFRTACMLASVTVILFVSALFSALIGTGLMRDVLGAYQQKPAPKADALDQPSATPSGGRSRQPPPSPPAAQEPVTPARSTPASETPGPGVNPTDDGAGSPSRQKAAASGQPSPRRSSGTGSPASTRTKASTSTPPISLEQLSQDSRSSRKPRKRRRKASSAPSVEESGAFSEPPPTTVHTIRL
ncbi:high-affinity choline transporter 1-like [Amblyomma americanum]